MAKNRSNTAAEPKKALLFANGAENEVGVLLGHVFQLGLGAVEEAFAFKTARTNGYFALVHVVTGSAIVFVHAEQHLYAHALVFFEHIVEGKVGGIKQGGTAYGENGYVQAGVDALSQRLPGQINGHEHAEG